MRKIWAIGTFALLSMAMVGCGSATETLSTSISSGVTAYIVVSTDSQSALNLVNSKNTGGGSSVSVASGDSHSGSQVCSTSLSHEGHTYSVTFYLNGNLPAAENTALAGACAQLQKDASQSGSSDWTG